jgi:hypothetical protein
VIICSTEVITPEKAAELLSHNFSNRPVRKNHVSGLASAIKRGEWRLTHQGIAVSESGGLVDGQHRLHAIIQAGVPVTAIVVRGVDASTFDSIDIGERRSLSDTLKCPPRVASVYALANRLVNSGGKTTPQQALRWAEANGQQTRAMIAATQQTRAYVSSSGMLLAGVCSMLDGVDQWYVTSMYHRLVLADMEALPPAGRALLSFLLRSPPKLGGTELQFDALARGHVIFKPANAALTRVLVRDTSTAADWARTLLKQAVQP